MEDTARQHYIIGDNLRHKGFYEDAIDELEKALDIREALLGPWHVDTGKTFYALGLARRATKEYREALGHLHSAAKAFEECEARVETKGSLPNAARMIKDCKLNLARTHHSQGVDYQRAGDYDASILEHRKAQAIRETYLGSNNLETARTYYVLGCALSDRGDFDEALSELRRCFRVRTLVFGKEHMDTLEVLGNITTVLSVKGDVPPDQIVEYRLQIGRSVHHELQGDNYFIQKQYEDAMVEYRRALSLEEQCLGELHPTTLDLYLRMADSFGRTGDLEASLAEYKSAILIYEQLLGKFHVQVAGIYDKLAGLLMEKGEYETALSFYCKAYGIYDSTLGNQEDTVQALANVRIAAEKERNARQSMDKLKISPSSSASTLTDKPKEVKTQEEGGKDSGGGGKGGRRGKKNKSKKAKEEEEVVAVTDDDDGDEMDGVDVI
jgi:tetratricopeptide (TPR) repeat protein